MKILNTYCIKLAMVLLLLIGVNQHSTARDGINIARIDNYGQTVKINFFANGIDPSTLDAIRLYEAEGFTNDKNDFNKIKEYDFTNYPNIDTAINWTGQINSITSFKWNNFPYDKQMSYYLTYVKGNVESDIPDSTYYFFVQGPRDSINFTVSPPNLTTMEVGGKLNYTAKAVSIMQNTIHYKLINSPNLDAEINKLTGEFEFIASTVGEFTYTIRAYDKDNEDNNFADQKLKVKVYNCFTDIEGYITINNEVPSNLIRGSVDIYKKTQDSAMYESSATILQNGKFVARVDEGEYIIRANGFLGNQNISEWYNAKTNMNDADVILTTCGNTSSISWNIEYVNTSNYFVKMEQLTDYPFSFIAKGKTFEKKIEYTTNPKNEEVVFTLSSEEYFSLTGSNKDILKLNTTEPGFYNVHITARMKKYNKVISSQIARVWVTECDELNELTVIIIDKETGEEVKGYISANLFRLDSNERDSNYVSWNVDSTSTQDGKLVFNIDKGSYFLEAYIGVMVDGKYTNYRYVYNFDEPTKNNPNVKGETIKMDCENQTLTWEIKAPKEVKSYTISGYVTDENTNEAIQYAQIELVGKNKLTDEISRKYAYTNDNGYYTVRVLDNAVYSVSALSVYDTLDIKQYIREYWEETSNPLEATILDLTGNVENIDFTLTERAEYKNKLNGIVLDEDDDGVESASVVIYLIEPTAFDSEYKYWTASTKTNSDGEFEFENLIPGDYIIYTYTNNRQYKPGYYVEGKDHLELSWLDATKVSVEKSGDFGDVEVRLSPLKPIVSKNSITGKVGRLKDVSPGSVSATDPLNGVTVYVTDANGTIVNYNHSDQNGEFSIPNLVDGEMTVAFDKVGYQMAEEVIELDENTNTTYVSAELSPLGITSVEEFEKINATVYPNPSSGLFSLTGDFKSGVYTAKVTDMIGNVIVIKTIELNSSSNYSMNLSQLSSGQYLIQLIGNDSEYSTKVNIIK